MWLTPEYSGDVFGVKQHEEIRAKNAPKVAILMAYLITKLESIGEGNYFVGKDFPEEKIWEDLEDLRDTEEAEIWKIWDRYFDTICQKLGIK